MFTDPAALQTVHTRHQPTRDQGRSWGRASSRKSTSDRSRRGTGCCRWHDPQRAILRGFRAGSGRTIWRCCVGASIDDRANSGY